MRSLLQGMFLHQKHHKRTTLIFSLHACTTQNDLAECHSQIVDLFQLHLCFRRFLDPTSTTDVYQCMNETRIHGTLQKHSNSLRKHRGKTSMHNFSYMIIHNQSTATIALQQITFMRKRLPVDNRYSLAQEVTSVDERTSEKA